MGIPADSIVNPAPKPDRPAAVLVREEIRKARRSVMVAASGQGHLLDLLDRYVVETETRLARLECAAIRRGEGG